MSRLDPRRSDNVVDRRRSLSLPFISFPLCGSNRAASLSLVRLYRMHLSPAVSLLYHPKSTDTAMVPNNATRIECSSLRQKLTVPCWDRRSIRLAIGGEPGSEPGIPRPVHHPINRNTYSRGEMQLRASMHPCQSEVQAASSSGRCPSRQRCRDAKMSVVADQGHATHAGKT